ncbi:alpha/beta fold hydrolase [Myxococcota bacterium]|nr:alpha/beta fold hydrolase [Myxococcota bacterium]
MKKKRAAAKSARATSERGGKAAGRTGETTNTKRKSSAAARTEVKAKSRKPTSVARRTSAAVPTTIPAPPPVVRTADARFRNLPGYPFAPHYIAVTNPYAKTPLRMHYVDEGPTSGDPKKAPVVLMVHGEPSWSYLYRKMIPVFAAAGLRAIAVDLVGFGRSDKLTKASQYSFANHIDWLRQLVVGLDLHEITLIGQDWGGPIGMGVLVKEMERFARVVAGNTMLHTAEPELDGRIDWAVHANGDFASTVDTRLLDWMHTTHRLVDFDASPSIAGSTVRPVPKEVLAAYDAPFPSEWHKAGMRQFSVLIPVTRSDVGCQINRETWQALSHFDRPFLTLFSDSDPATRGWEKIFAERVPGARGQPHAIQARAGHFWQEDNGAEAARIIADWIAATG